MAWAKTSRHARGYGTAWTKLRAIVLAEEPLCRICKRNGKVKPASHVDHMTPKAKGGTDHRSNLQALCAEHHTTKTLTEAAEAQGRTYKPRPTFNIDGWPT